MDQHLVPSLRNRKKRPAPTIVLDDDAAPAPQGKSRPLTGAHNQPHVRSYIKNISYDAFVSILRFVRMSDDMLRLKLTGDRWIGAGLAKSDVMVHALFCHPKAYNLIGGVASITAAGPRGLLSFTFLRHLTLMQPTYACGDRPPSKSSRCRGQKEGQPCCANCALPYTARFPCLSSLRVDDLLVRSWATDKCDFNDGTLRSMFPALEKLDVRVAKRTYWQPITDCIASREWRSWYDMFWELRLPHSLRSLTFASHDDMFGEGGQYSAPRENYDGCVLAPHVADIVEPPVRPEGGYSPWVQLSMDHYGAALRRKQCRTDHDRRGCCVWDTFSNLPPLLENLFMGPISVPFRALTKLPPSLTSFRSRVNLDHVLCPCQLPAGVDILEVLSRCDNGDAEFVAALPATIDATRDTLPATLVRLDYVVEESLVSGVNPMVAFEQIVTRDCPGVPRHSRPRNKLTDSFPDGIIPATWPKFISLYGEDFDALW